MFLDKEKAEKELLSLLQTNSRKKDRVKDMQEYYEKSKIGFDENVGAYRLEEHEIIQ